MGLEEADAAMEASLESKPTEQTETVTDQTTETKDLVKETTEVPDLGAIAKFKFQGKEWTPKELENAYLRQEDYSRKTKELADERRFAENFSADLKNLAKDPSLLAEFKKIYPDKYHAQAESILELLRNNPQMSPQQAQHISQQEVKDPRVDEVLKWKEQFDRKQQEEAVKTAEAQIDSVFTKMGKKYPLAAASEELVISRANALLDHAKAERRGDIFRKEDGSVNEDAWDKVWKSVNDTLMKSFESHYKSQFVKQKTASEKAKDTAPGGAIPGEAPKRMTFKEATEAAEAFYANRS